MQILLPSPRTKWHYYLALLLSGWLPLLLTGQTTASDSLGSEPRAFPVLQCEFDHLWEVKDYPRATVAGLRLRDAALASGEEHHDLLLDTYHLLLYAYHHRNLIDSALLIFREATDYGESRPPHWQMSEIYLRGFYLLEGPEGKRLLDLSRKNSILFNDTNNLAYLHFHYSEIFIDNGGPEDSIHFHLQSATDLFNQLNNFGGLLLMKSHQANWNAKQGRTELALADYSAIYGICKANHFNDAYCNDCGYQIGKQFLQLNVLDSAYWYTENCLTRAESRSDYGVIAHCHELLANINEGRQDFKRAFYHEREYHNFSEKVHTEATQAAIAAEKVRQNNEAIIEAREKAELEAQLLVATNRQYRTLGFGLLGILLLGGGLLWKLNRTRASLARSNAELDAINQTKDKFFGLIAHDLQGPVIALGTVGGQLKYLLDNNKNQEALETGKQVEGAAKRLSRLLDNLLKWALIKKGMIPYRPERLNLATIAEDNIALFLDTAELKNVTMSSDIRREQFVYADPRAVSTVFRNLVNNALKFTPSGGEIRLSARVVSGGVEMAVSDDGIGIPPDKLSKLFKLASGASFGTAGEKGTGLGLVLCQELVKLNGGNIRVESRDGRGSTFFVTWPLARG